MQQQELVCPLIIILQSNDPVLCTFMCPVKWSINYCTLQQQAGEVCSRRAITATHGMYTVGPKPIPLHWLQSNCQSIQSVRGLGWWMVMYNTLLLAARGHEAKQRPVSQSLHPTPAIAHSLTHSHYCKPRDHLNNSCTTVHWQLSPLLRNYPSSNIHHRDKNLH